MFFYSKMERVRHEATQTWQKQRNGSIVMVSGGVLAASVLPPTASVILGGMGILYVAFQQPPGGFFARLYRVS